MKKQSTSESEMQVVALQTGRVSFCLRGITPLIYNSVSLKSKQSLLIPSSKKTAVEKAGSLKHEPIEEYRASVYRHRDDTHETRLFFPGGGFKAALKSAALRMPGLRKSEIAQLTWVEGRDIDVYGVPQIYLAQVRSADISRTPDIRTRAICPQWAARLSVSYVRPQMSDKSIVNLVAAAGLLCGIGDGRQERGYGNGQFEIVADADEQFQNIVAAGGREAQDAALASPAPFDVETEELLAIFETEVAKRGDSIVRRVA